mmetsp:Transcript_87084/g.281167  ORF Transcript_87084/g.281167 Transcript_87084/m.281167 type:complete len:256 (-) Transcript_87084:1373-2140(-)
MRRQRRWAGGHSRGGCRPGAKHAPPKPRGHVPLLHARRSRSGLCSEPCVGCALQPPCRRGPADPSRHPGRGSRRLLWSSDPPPPLRPLGPAHPAGGSRAGSRCRNRQRLRRRRGAGRAGSLPRGASGPRRARRMGTQRRRQCTAATTATTPAQPGTTGRPPAGTADSAPAPAPAPVGSRGKLLESTAGSAPTAAAGGTSPPRRRPRPRPRRRGRRPRPRAARPLRRGPKSPSCCGAGGPRGGPRTTVRGPSQNPA